MSKLSKTRLKYIRLINQPLHCPARIAMLLRKLVSVMHHPAASMLSNIRLSELCQRPLESMELER